MTNIKLANAPCSWGVMEFDLEGGQNTYTRVLDEMSQAGYVGTELGDWGFMPTDPIKLKEELNKRKLSMLAAFVPVALADESAHKEGIQAAVRVAKLLAQVSTNPFVVLSDDNGREKIRTNMAGRITAAQQLTEKQWSTFTKGAEQLARTVLEEAGVKTVFHHHCAGYIETPDEVDRFMNDTNPLLIGLCLDTGHYTFAGGDALEAFKKYSERIWHVHFKDCDQQLAKQSRQEQWDYFQSVKNGIFCELGKGVVDFAAISQELIEHRYSGWIVVEQDVLPGMGSPLESAIRNRAYLQNLGI